MKNKPYKVITIERLYASAGREIGELAAKKLGIAFHNEDILEKAAEKCGIDIEKLKSVEETSTSILHYPITFKKNAKRPLTEQIFETESEIIMDMAKKEPCVIVGRCADYILKNAVKTLTVFIYSSAESRLDRAVNVYGTDEDKAEDYIKAMDKKRGEFYNANCPHKWGNKENYHICLDSGKLGVETCADIIIKLFEDSNVVQENKKA